MGHIEWMVGNRHVSESYGSVIRWVISRLSGKYKTFKSWPKAKRREFLRCIVTAHRDNRELYDIVMGGV